MRILQRAICIAIAVVATLSSSVVQAQYWVSAQGYTNAFTGVINNFDWIGGSQNGTGDLLQSLYSIGANAAGSDIYCTNILTQSGSQCVPSTESASATVSGSVAPGVVHLDATSEGQLSPVVFTDANGNQFPAVGTGQGTTEVNVQWSDQVTFGGLVPGTPITVVFTMALDGTLGLTGDNNPPQGQDAGEADFYAYLNNPVSTLLERGTVGSGYTPGGAAVNGFPGGTYSVTGTVLSGQTYTLSGGASLFARAIASAPASPDVVAYVDAGNTVQSFVEVLTPGATFSSASGATYAPVTSTPEPATLALLATGLIPLAGGLTRRRTNRG